MVCDKLAVLCLCRQAAEEAHVQMTVALSYHKQRSTGLEATRVITGV